VTVAAAAVDAAADNDHNKLIANPSSILRSNNDGNGYGWW